jgi:aminopeptidase YwaD
MELVASVRGRENYFRQETTMKRLPLLLAVLGVLCAGSVMRGQEAEDRTLLNWAQMHAIIDEASGERAMHHVLELVPYQRVRSPEEYSGHMREAEMMVKFAKEYGYSNVEIEDFPTQGRDWRASKAQLWMVQPTLEKLYDVYDVAISVCSGSETGDVTAEVVDVGLGSRESDYAGKDVTGKIVLGSAGATNLQRLGVFGHGAVGVISYTVLFPDDQPDISLSQGISTTAPEGKHPGFGWAVSARMGRNLSARLQRGDKISMRSVVQSETYPGRLEVVHAMIPGDGSTEQAIVVSAHLFEGYIKDGANDDNSGCAVTLEMGRTIIQLVREGKIPRPKRAIHFLWVPEISGTNAWLNAHADMAKRFIADLNFDMEGLGLARGGSMWVLLRTPDTTPSYINDVAQSVMEVISNTNRQRVRYRAHGYDFSVPVLSANGTRDPFYTWTSQHYGSSDHVTYMQHGIPAIIFSTWPDPWYHSSQDTPDKLDSTQFKRVAVVGAAAAEILSSADDTMAARITAESLGRGSERLGEAQRKGLGYLADAVQGDEQLYSAYKDALNAVNHQAEIEKAVIGSTTILYLKQSMPDRVFIEQQRQIIDKHAEILNAQLTGYYSDTAEHKWGQLMRKLDMTDAEKLAARTFLERVPAPAGGRGGAGGGGGGGGRGGATPSRIPQHMNAELSILINQKKSVLEIRDFLSGEFEPLPLADLMDYFQAQEKAGAVKLVVQPEPPPPPATKGKKPTKKKGAGNY